MKNEYLGLGKQHIKFDVIMEIVPDKCCAMILVLSIYYPLTWMSRNYKYENLAMCPHYLSDSTVS